MCIQNTIAEIYVAQNCTQAENWEQQFPSEKKFSALYFHSELQKYSFVAGEYFGFSFRYKSAFFIIRYHIYSFTYAGLYLFSRHNIFFYRQNCGKCMRERIIISQYICSIERYVICDFQTNIVVDERYVILQQKSL